MNYHVMTLFPEMIDAATDFSILKRAKDDKIINIQAYNIRDYSTNKHKKVDDYPFGGGSGMVMSPEPIVRCHEAICRQTSNNRRTIYLSPKGRTFNQEVARELLKYEDIILLCGHYEGIDQRAINQIVDEEISIGDYVLTGGEIPAIAIIEATARLVDNVLSKPESHQEESFSNLLLEYPQYTRPRVFEELEVPEVLLSGNHRLIENWRMEESLRITLERRRDLLDKAELTKEQIKILKKILQQSE